MRFPILSLLAVLVTSTLAHAGQLNLAVLQFTDARDPSEITSALAQVDLLKVTNSDRVETNVAGLRGGYVVFAQSIGVPSSGNFGNSTRIGNQRADVSGSLGGGRVNVEIAIEEGVKVGLRKFTRSVYSGSGEISRVPQIISIKQSKGRSQIAIKGDAKLTSYNFTSVLVAQYLP